MKVWNRVGFVEAIMFPAQKFSFIMRSQDATFMPFVLVKVRPAHKPQGNCLSAIFSFPSLVVIPPLLLFDWATFLCYNIL